MNSQYLRRYDLRKPREGSWRSEGLDLHCFMNCSSSAVFSASIIRCFGASLSLWKAFLRGEGWGLVRVSSVSLNGFLRSITVQVYAGSQCHVDGAGSLLMVKSTMIVMDRIYQSIIPCFTLRINSRAFVSKNRIPCRKVKCERLD